MEEEDTKSVASEVQPDLSDSTVVTKYRLAADIANRALQGVLTQCVAGKPVVQICEFGDKLIEHQCSGVFKAKKIDKGIAFPTCVSLNECAGYYSPLPSESMTLKPGDSVKIDLGCHIDGFVAVVGHTIVVPASEEEAAKPITGRKADCLTAAHIAGEVAQKLIKPGTKSADITTALEKVSECFGVQPVLGVTCHEMKRYVIEGNNIIPLKHDPEQKVDEFEVEANQVYQVDIMMSTGDGKVREHDTRTTVFKREVDQNYRLKMKASRYVLTEVNKRFPTMPFSLRMLDDERNARMGVVECVKHQLLQPYPVMFEREGEFIAHVKFTVLVLPSGTLKVTGLPWDDAKVTSDKEASDEVKAYLALSAKRTGKKKKKKAKKNKTEATEPTTSE